MNAPIDHHSRAFNTLRERIAADFGLDPDDQAVIDTTEGETDLAGLLIGIIRQVLERTAQADVCALQIMVLHERKARHMAAADKLRAAAADVMLETGLTKLAPGDFTASARMTKPRPEIIDEKALPTRFQKAKIVADKEAVNSEYERCQAEGDAFAVPGVVISNGRPSLTVRT